MLSHSELGHTILVHDFEPKQITVAVSSAGTKLSEESFEPKFTDKEINGPGCGVCRQAPISVALPPMQP